MTEEMQDQNLILDRPTTIEEAWSRIENALQYAITRHGIFTHPKTKAIGLVNELARKDKISPQHVTLFHDLRAFKEGKNKSMGEAKFLRDAWILAEQIREW